jgi:hypothetical protein
MSGTQLLPNPPAEIISSEYDGRSRRLVAQVCQTCSKTIYAPKHVNRRFCDKTCRGLSERTRVEKKCSWCATMFTLSPHRVGKTKSGLYFCSRGCKDRAQRLDGFSELHPSHYGTGKSGAYRLRAIKAYGARCSSCGYHQDVRMLDVDHINGDRANGDVRNLQVLCVWCHALKTRGVPEHERAGPQSSCSQEAS